MYNNSTQFKHFEVSTSFLLKTYPISLEAHAI